MHTRTQTNIRADDNSCVSDVLSVCMSALYKINDSKGLSYQNQCPWTYMMSEVKDQYHRVIRCDAGDGLHCMSIRLLRFSSLLLDLGNIQQRDQLNYGTRVGMSSTKLQSVNRALE